MYTQSHATGAFMCIKCQDCGIDLNCTSYLCESCLQLRKVIFDGSVPHKLLLQLQALNFIKARNLNKCCHCGFTGPVDISYRVSPEHFIGKKLDVINCEFNLMLLCSNCQWDLGRCRC